MMSLTKTERAKITDSVHSIQSARSSLAHVDESKIPNLGEINDCLQDADKTLRVTLRQSSASKKKPT
jgi:hypothetical protein